MIRSRRHLAILLLALALANTACPFGIKSASDVEKVENKLDQATNGVNALAKTARELYRQNVINLSERQLAGKLVEEVNDGLEAVSDRVIQIDPDNPESIKLGKIDVEGLLNKVIEKLNKFNIGNQQLQLAAQAIIPALNEAIRLVRLVKEVRK